MAFAIGDRFGVYEVTGTLGEGGMGQVYRATDTKLKRQVALKTLPPSFAADHDRLARFQREAEVLASLNHPHIAAIYGLEEHPSTSSGQAITALVMELVEGEDLSQRIARPSTFAQGVPSGVEGRGLPVDEALAIAKQIAEALEAAHEQGIVHRDLKPANIKVRADGVAKVLDFGLAKALEPAAAGPSAPMLVSMSPTRVRPVDGDAINSPAYTQLGVVLGTAAYMSPEQARGRAVDKRSDIWAFGAVLYEMLTGARAFAGEDITDVIAAVVKDTPNWAALPADVPPNVVTLIQRCLDKDRKTRIGDIAVARFLLSDHASSAIGTAPTTRSGTSRDRVRSAIWTRVLPWAVTAVMAALVAALYLRPSPDAPLEKMTFELLPPDGVDLDRQIRISPDGRLIAFAASGDGETRRRVWVRALDSLQARPLAGTEGAEVGLVWLPDNRTIVFASSGKLRKINVTGGPAQAVCDFSAELGGGFLTADNRIVFGTPATEGIQACPAGGGAARPITALKPGGQDAFHAFPSLLPDGKHFLFWRQAGPESGVYLGSLDAKPEEQNRMRLLPDNSAPVYVPGADADSGHVLFVRDGTLMAQRFEMRTLSLTGDAMPVADNVRRPMAFSASLGGALVYLTGAGNTAQLTWFDRTGKSLGTLGGPGRTFFRMRMSPDGTRVAAARSEAGGAPDIWIVDLAQGTETRLTTNPAVDTEPVWSPDGRRIVFTSTRDGANHLYVRAADGAGTDELVLKTDERKFPLDWSSDGKWLLFASMTAKGVDVWVLPMATGPAGGRKPVPYLRGDAAEDYARFSPDGRWVAYSSNESGSDELYVRPFDPAAPEASGTGGGKVRVSLTGIDGSPRWDPDGKGLTYFATGGKRWLVDVTTTPPLRVGAPRLLGAFSGALLFENVASTPDNQRVLVDVPAGNQQPSATVVLNWQAGLKP